ncbi:MAG: hypothetical protein IIC36_11430 [Gemmatimonadetes bacterium]|nr:hypothetical protein [Gemmatimonadota bacterium]
MDRKIVAIGVLLTGLLVAMPVLAQDYVWTSDRPDGHAPAGVKSDFLLPFGDLYIGYRYSSQKFRGTLVGTDVIADFEILDFFSVAPVALDRWTGEIDVRFGLTPFLTLEGSIPWVRNEILNTTDTGFFESSSEFLGDISVRGLFEILKMDGYRLSATLGATIPFGKISKRGLTSSGVRGVLPFPMQGGSGSPDVLVGATFLAQNELASMGAQFNSVIRVVNNGKGYRLGDEFDFTVWGAYNVTDWVSFSLRGLFAHQGDIQGSDSRTDGTVDPMANPFAQGGERVVIPFGINLYLRDGKAAGHRLSIEFYYPIHEDLNGPQMSIDRTLVLSWQTVF